MMYYTKDSKLYAMDTPVEDNSFVQITEDEYNARMRSAVENREISSGGIVDEDNGSINVTLNED